MNMVGCFSERLSQGRNEGGIVHDAVKTCSVKEKGMPKQIYTILALVALTVLTGFVCEAEAGNVPEETIRMERKLLESKIESLQQRFARDPNNQTPQNQEFYNRGINAVLEKLRRLDADPELYFYEQSRGQGTQPTRGRDNNAAQCMGNCANEQGICLSQCMGNGQCISNCYSAHSRCVSRCN